MDTKKFKVEVGKIESTIKVIRFLGWLFVIIGFAILIIGLYDWLIKGEPFNEVGDFIGGVSGSLWALAGLFFIYIAFLGQKIEIKYQQEELKLTREELKESKEVFKEQARIMQNQSIDSAFFNLLDSHRKFIDSFKRGESERSKRIEMFDTSRGTKVISGYEVLEEINERLLGYLNRYANYIQNRNVFDTDMTLSTPIAEIEKYAEVKLLYDEVKNIVSNFILKKIAKENQPFYFTTLFNNFSNEEKFLITVYNINCTTEHIPELDFDNYLQHDFPSFLNSDDYIKNIFLDLVEVNRNKADHNFWVKLDAPEQYEAVELYFADVEGKSLELVHSFNITAEKIYLLETLADIVLDRYPNFKYDYAGKTLDVYFLIRSKHTQPFCNIFDYVRMDATYFTGFGSERVEFMGKDTKYPSKWIQEHFNNLKEDGS